uniref:Transmembrane protein 192 n=1 Tax=Poecilia reticulata TaxID=8081 RepID=A0A3P9MS19_POERE
LDQAGVLLQQAGSSADMTRSTEEDSLVDGPLISADALQSAMRREFQSVPTTCPAGFLSLMHVRNALSAPVLLVSSGCVRDAVGVCGRVVVIVFGKVFLWVLMLLHTAWMHHHHSRVRSRGYLSFYRRTQRLKQLPLVIHSTGGTAHSSLELRFHYIHGVILVAVPCLLYYTVRVMQFNRRRAAPDVSQEEHSHSYSVTNQPTETGFRGSSGLEEVVEKQADLIEYLKQHNTLLSKRLLNHTAQH